ncbi:membrane-bound lytic murein transglycosylase B [Streptomyces sp. SAI-135]|uniref:lytic transglycosylase domain-containing protein n=1 Tax=unclassified Streptomyces TaxID=2593676 RepID=UPI002475D9C6|nr:MULTISPECIES: lytic murein transglycosylase [unclassified Streptomyces]MDH6519787.1 membrane-bound lytic murein transglycosylase B [Streptomyces sp. SAI-090]MDH6571090.1 membrane-bound lytic murein transglycosylase B [Streptomyces sp. SAI-117]MDH6616119.1 membrane-bound lytic murein transglycosylase B [Streptomyces sp. SAI-135]
MAAQFGRRLRKGAVTTAVAAAAVAALSASQAPGATVDDHGRSTAADAQPSPDEATGDGATGNSPYYTDLPPLNTPSPAPTDGTSTTSPVESTAGIPATVLDAYKKAAAELQESKPGCNLPWQLLAAIGQVESGQARGGRVDADGTTTSKILGPQLDGNGFALIKDTDNGAYDGDTAYDSAVGPMQFIPSTWAWAGRDGNGDGVKDPNNIYDAALATGHYLCRYSWDLSDSADLDRAILSYNPSRHYVNTVLSWLEYFRKGTHEIPDGTGTLPGNRSDGGSGSTTSPSSPSTPSAPHTPRPTTPGSPSTTPPSTTPPPSGTPTTPPSTPVTPTQSVDHLEDSGTAKLTAMAGDAFSEKISTKAENAAGKGVAKVRIRYTIVGDTDATFAGGEKVATALTNASGVATAPALQAGETTGSFAVRATLIGRTVTGPIYSATVTQRVADALVRTGDTALTCTPGGQFTDAVQVKATYKDAVADKVAATATLIKSADDATANDKGPYFKDADGKTVRTLTGLTTDADGLLKLPQLYADDTTGTYLLRITTAGGATLDVTLTVAAATDTSTDAPASPSPSPSAS